MGNVIVTLKAMPTGVDVNLDELESAIKEKVNPDRIEREPVAFGLFAIKIVIVIPEEDGKLDKVQEELKSLEGIKEVEVVTLTKSL